MEFGERLVGALTELAEHLLDAHRVRTGIVWAEARERTEQARRFADVGRLEPQVVIEVGARAVTALAFAIGHPADRQQISSEQSDTVVKRQPLAGIDLVGDLGEAGSLEPER
jgi:hypothetical protein